MVFMPNITANHAITYTKTGENISAIYDTGERQIHSSSAYKAVVMQRVAHVSIY